MADMQARAFAKRKTRPIWIAQSVAVAMAEDAALRWYPLPFWALRWAPGVPPHRAPLFWGQARIQDSPVFQYAPSALAFEHDIKCTFATVLGMRGADPKHQRAEVWMIQPVGRLKADFADGLALALACDDNNAPCPPRMGASDKRRKSVMSLTERKPMQVDATVDRHFAARKAPRGTAVNVRRRSQIQERRREFAQRRSWLEIGTMRDGFPRPGRRIC